MKFCNRFCLSVLLILALVGQEQHQAQGFHVLDIFVQYQHALHEHPLFTKMATGGTLATTGDAIAQFQQTSKYDTKRAASFGTFDMAYRALQHYSFPFITTTCQGNILRSAAMEQTLASQLGIVPFLYYPVFFTLTGYIQGLSWQQTRQRAGDNFVTLMKRNLLFWIPVQYVQFQYIPEELQIPFLSVAGLCWTCILSLSAGSTAKYTTNSVQQQVEEQTLEVQSSSATSSLRNATSVTASV